MKLLLILLTLMTFTVKDKNSVTADGQWPYDMDAEFANSSSQGKGNVGKGDVATLTVTGLGGLIVEKVDVYVNSNKTAGAGTFTVSVNEKTVATKSGTFKDWTGAYDSSTYHAIRVLNQACSNVETISITLTGTTNSLHIEKYVLSYGELPPRKVTLLRGNEVYATLEEETAGQGVLLPSLTDKEPWRFVGWSETAFILTESLPFLYGSNSAFYPVDDTQLWAVYRYSDSSEQIYVSDLESGEYLYVNRTNNLALTGIPSEGIMRSLPVDMTNESQVYSIDFVGSDTAYITHLSTGAPIGYSGTKMSAKASPWLVYHKGEETIFYTIINGKKYVLWLNVLDSYLNQYAGLFQVDEFGISPMVLCYPDPPDKPVYSCYPEAVRGLDEVSVEPPTGTYIFPFGCYNLVIHNGKKRLVIRKQR